MTQLELAANDIITPLMEKVASLEGVNAPVILSRLKEGTIVIPFNKKSKAKKPCGIGFGLRTKINANIGTSTDKTKLEFELAKLKTACKYGADTVMDLSVGGDLPAVRRRILSASLVPVGTVPIYEVAVNAQRKKRSFLKFGIDDILETLEKQASDGVDFFTIHAGITRKSLKALTRSRRIMGIVSRGGAIIASWMYRNKKENPFYEHFDRILEIAHKYDVCLSLGDGLRPGTIFDATDNAQLAELRILGQLCLRARRKSVQVMIEGPGHVPINHIQKNVFLEKKICHGAPFYVLGPLVTDVACGYDHISSAIGAALAASYGADFLCYVTPAEHLRLPSIDDVKNGVVASKIAAHAADIAKNIPQAVDWDRQMSVARKARDWKKQIELALDPIKAKQYRLSSRPKESSVCTMCGKYCSIKVMEECLRA